MNDKEVMAVVLVLAMICTLIGFAYHERTKSDDAYSRRLVQGGGEDRQHGHRSQCRGAGNARPHGRGHVARRSSPFGSYRAGEQVTAREREVKERSEIHVRP